MDRWLSRLCRSRPVISMAVGLPVERPVARRERPFGVPSPRHAQTGEAFASPVCRPPVASSYETRFLVRAKATMPARPVAMRA